MQILLALLFFFLGALKATCFDQLVNSNSSAETKALYKRLTDNYGKFVLSGQTSFHYDDLSQRVNRHPLIQAFDMQNYSPHNPWFNWQPYDDGTVLKAIQWYHSTNKKGIVSFHWHWFSPMGGSLRTSTFYTNYTDFNVNNAVTAGTIEYNLTLRDIDAIAVQLSKLKSEGIPIIWRPLHEAGGGWFWWGSKTSSSAIKLYLMMYERLTYFHSLNNLIWTWSTPEPAWYPGNIRVDMVGYDSYPGSYNYTCQTNIYQQIRSFVSDHKMIHMSENGPIPNFKSCWEQGAKWGYFLSWSDLVFSQNSDEHLI